MKAKMIMFNYLVFVAFTIKRCNLIIERSTKFSKELLWNLKSDRLIAIYINMYNPIDMFKIDFGIKNKMAIMNVQ